MSTRLLERIDRELAAAGGAAARTRLLQGAGWPDHEAHRFAQALDPATPIERRAPTQWRHRGCRLLAEGAATGSGR